MTYLRQAGGRAAARSALPDARAWFEQALSILKGLPESQATLEQAFDIRLELRPVLRQLGEVRQMLEHLREAEALADRLRDDGRSGRVCAFMTTVLSTLNELDQALVTGSRALEIAQRLGDLRLRIVSTGHLEQAHYYRGDYEHVIELATDNLAALPDDWAHEYFGTAVPPSVFARGWLIMSLAEIGRFAEAAKYEAETIRLAEPTQHTHNRLGVLGRKRASSPPGPLGAGALAGRTRGKCTSERRHRRPSSLGDHLIRLGAGADRRA